MSDIPESKVMSETVPIKHSLPPFLCHAIALPLPLQPLMQNCKWGEKAARQFGGKVEKWLTLPSPPLQVASLG